MEPDRNFKYSTNVYKPEYIICCNAGYGLFDDYFIPFGFVSRISRTMEAIHRKVQDFTMKRLHHYASRGQIKGFILPYLGQQDKTLPISISDLVPREKINYPTDFKAMTEEKIDMISKRGEQLTTFLLDYYLSEL